MLSMTLACLGWATWWVVFLLRRFFPEQAIGWTIPILVSPVFAVPGLIVALLTVRAQRSWMLFVLVPLFANASQLAMPWLVREFSTAPP